MTVTEERIRASREFLRGRDRERRRQLDVLFRQATEDFGRMRDLVVTKYHPRLVYQWGSLVDRSHFSEMSDIDIAVSGEFSPERFFAMLGDIEAETAFPVDLVDLDRIEPEFRDLILLKGRVVYERRD